jgi:alkanesulfonate monooxygenase SsuD/methylene tetrahydromethanopterin reductase-like flavin-dependent oxidoreductase (luciferase family)
MPETSETHLAVALDGAGWHPAAWREPGARPAELFTAGYWADLAREAEAGTLDFLTIEDSLGLQRPGRGGPRVGDRGDQVRGRLDATLIAARIAPLTAHIGLIPTVVTTHTEPFHVSTAIATLDYVSEGRAGWRPRISASPREAAHFGRREFPELTPENTAHLSDLFDEAADAVEVVRRLWDSWDDDAVIRDVPTGRFVDRDKLHYIDFEGRWFAVRGPSITPRPPQGQPIVAALAHAALPYRFAARSSDVVFVTPADADHAARIVAEVRAAEVAVNRPGEADGIGAPLLVYADLVVFIDERPGVAAGRKRRLDELDGAEFATDCAVVAGTPGEVAGLLLDWRTVAGLDGFRLRPGTLPHDLERISRALVPELRRRGAFRAGYAQRSLRERLGLSRPASRYGGSRHQIGAA